MAHEKNFYETMNDVDALDPEDFWVMIETSRAISKSDGIPHHDALAQTLSLSAPSEIVRFQNMFYALSSQANSDAVHDIIGGSDDVFHYGISGLISMGRDSYESLLADPNGFKAQVAEYEIFEYAAFYAFEEPTRARLQAVALARQEREILEGSLQTGPAKPGPRM